MLDFYNIKTKKNFDGKNNKNIFFKNNWKYGYSMGSLGTPDTLSTVFKGTLMTCPGRSPGKFLLKKNANILNIDKKNFFKKMFSYNGKF